MTKRERAILALATELAVINADGPVQKVLGRALDAAMAIMNEPDQPPEGKLRVRVLVGLVESGDWYAHSASDGSREDSEEVISMAYEEPQFRWIEADVTPWQPPAEETVQGREVAG